MPTLATLIQQSIGSPSHRNKKERKGGEEGGWKEGIKKGKGIQIRQEDLRLLLLADDMILYIENPEDTTKNIIQLIRVFGDVAGCKINIQRSVLCLYTNNNLSEREIKETILFNNTSKRIKYLGVNLGLVLRKL